MDRQNIQKRCGIKYRRYTICRKRNIWVGYLIRHSRLIKTIFEGIVEGENTRGR